MYFVVSTGRSGTQSLTALLDSLPGHVCFHEPAPRLVRESASFRSGSMEQRAVTALLGESRKPVIDGSVYCESNQTISLLIPAAAEAFPQARFIWLMRSGLDVVASAYQKQWYSGHSENHSRYEDCPPLEREWIDWRVRGDQCGEMTEGVWEGLTRFEKCCWYWSYVNRIIAGDLASLPGDRSFFVRLETLAAQLPELLEWVGVGTERPVEIPMKNVALRVPYHWSGWSPEERESFAGRCGDVMDRHYPSWRGATGAEGTLFALSALSGLQAKAGKDSDEIIQLRRHLKEQIERSARLHRRLEGLMSTWSWKAAAPLRKLEDLLGLKGQEREEG